MSKRSGLFRSNKKEHNKVIAFLEKTAIFSLALFFTTATFVFALMPDGNNYLASYNYQAFPSSGNQATGTRLALSGQAVTSDSNTAFGVHGYSFSNAYVEKSATGVVGDAVGVYGNARASNGYPTSGGNVYGVWGDASIGSERRANATGVYGKISDEDGFSLNAFGVRGEVYDKSDSAESNYFGVYGFYKGRGIGFGVYGEVQDGKPGSSAIYGKGGDDSYAGYFSGRVKVAGDLILDSSVRGSTLCSVEGSVYYNSNLREICFCNGANWLKMATPSTLCE